jgi:hypothetical protein
VKFLWLFVAAIGVYLIIRHQTKWKTLLVRTGTDEAEAEVEAKCAFLKSEQIKCRVKSSGTSASAYGGSRETVRLEVHRNDHDRAKSLLEQYTEGGR